MVEMLSENDSLIGDGSASHHLPTVRGKHVDIQSISSQTVRLRQRQSRRLGPFRQSPESILIYDGNDRVVITSKLQSNLHDLGELS